MRCLEIPTLRPLPQRWLRQIADEARLMSDRVPDPRLVSDFLLPHLCEQHPRIYRALCARARDPGQALCCVLPVAFGGR